MGNNVFSGRSSTDKGTQTPPQSSTLPIEMQPDEPVSNDGRHQSGGEESPAIQEGPCENQLQQDVQQKTDPREYNEFCEVVIADLNRKLEGSSKRNKTLKDSAGRFSRKYNEAKRKEQELEQEVANLKDSQKQCDQLQKNYEQLKKDFNKVQATLKEREGEIADLQEAQVNIKSSYDLANKQAEGRELRIAQLQQEAEKQQLHITALTETISHSSQPSTTTRDDSYFSGEFARLAGAIRQCVLRYFDPRYPPKFRNRDLPTTFSQSLGRTVARYSSLPDSVIQVGRKEIEAVITNRLNTLVFNENPVFSTTRFNLPSSKAFLVPDIQIRKWHIQTTEMLTKQKSFESLLRTTTYKVAEDLQTCFLNLSKTGSEEIWQKALYSIAEHAVKLQIEICMQLSLFEVAQLNPGIPYSREIMDDRSGVVDSNDEDDEDGDGSEDSDGEVRQEGEKYKKKNGENKAEGGGGVQRRREFVVGMVLFPLVARWDFSEAGNFQKTPIIVRKATVIAVPCEPGNSAVVG